MSPPSPTPDAGRTAADAATRSPLPRLAQLSLRARVALVAAIGVGLMALLISVAAYVTVRVSLNREASAGLLQRAYAAVPGPLSDPSVIYRIPPEALGAADLRLALINASGQGVQSPGQRTQPPVSQAELAVARGLRSDSLRTVHADGESYRVAAVPAGTGTALVLAQSTADTDRSLKHLGVVLLVVGGAGVVLATSAGLAIARAGLQPVRRLTAAAERVARTHDLTPIPVSGTDEIARLVHSFNTMLTALAEARRRQRQLIADAGHELRTPLTSLRTNLDLLAQSEGRPGLSAEDRTALLRDVRAQAGELTTLVRDLVELSREDPPSAAHESVDLAEVVSRALERVRRRAPSLRFATDLRPWPLDGDAQALERAVTNLLDNAAKWSPHGGTVEVSLREGTLAVADRGPGIAESDLPRVFDRFYRSPEARSLPGSGLGLAIVKQVAERHGGWVRAERRQGGGTVLRLGLPRQPDGRAQRGQSGSHSPDAASRPAAR